MEFVIKIEKEHLVFLVLLVLLVGVGVAFAAWTPDKPYHEPLYTDSIESLSGGPITVASTPTDSKIVVQGTGSQYDQSIEFKDEVGSWFVGQNWISAENKFGIGNSAQKDMFVIESNGEVGIGTVNPGYKLDVNGDLHVNNGWIRTTGGGGWYSQTYGGGWHMTDLTWLRAYGGKPVYVQDKLRADQGFEVGNNGDKFKVDNAGNVYVGGMVTGDLGLVNGFVEGEVGNWNTDDTLVGVLPQGYGADDCVTFLQGFRDERCSSWDCTSGAYVVKLALCTLGEGADANVYGRIYTDDTGIIDGTLRCGYICHK